MTFYLPFFPWRLYIYTYRDMSRDWLSTMAERKNKYIGRRLCVYHKKTCCCRRIFLSLHAFHPTRWWWQPFLLFIQMSFYHLYPSNKSNHFGDLMQNPTEIWLFLHFFILLLIEENKRETTGGIILKKKQKKILYNPILSIREIC